MTTNAAVRSKKCSMFKAGVVDHQKTRRDVREGQTRDASLAFEVGIFIKGTKVFLIKEWPVGSGFEAAPKLTLLRSQMQLSFTSVLDSSASLLSSKGRVFCGKMSLYKATV